MNGTMTVRPVGNLLDILDEVLRPYDPNEEEGDNREEDDARKGEDNDETISLEEEEGVNARIGKIEGTPTNRRSPTMGAPPPTKF